MPERKTHLLIDRLLLGKEYPFVHGMLDIATPILGPHHRRVTHTPEMLAYIFLKSGGNLNALIAGEIHILADREFSRSQKFLRKLLTKH